MSLRSSYDGLVCDLDGVVYRGPDPVPHAVEVLDGGTAPVVYATNNASRPPAAVVEHLRRLGLTLDDDAVVTSSQAGARRLAGRVPTGARVLAVGGEGVTLALRERGLEPLAPADLRAGADPVVAVLQGYGPEVTAADLAEAAYAVEGGADWVATNTDGTLPTDRGVAPGNGTLVSAVARATGTQPEVVGKPEADLYDVAAERLGSRRLLGVGDRLDTDILGADAAGMDSLWVLTGVHDLASLADVAGSPQPTYVARDLRALDADPVPVRQEDGWTVAGGHRARLADERLEVERTRPVADADPDVAEAEVLAAGLRLLLTARDAGTDADRLRDLAHAVDDAARTARSGAAH
ncbi:HAD-IIA family hydrolase [Lapillicoccus jejuensis]|uniref:HAD superfamily hydrolase (TIGR01450 family) n=1 Tax=Lapillicoccus jejuensis TaxID=402171 RepID=A0A542E6L8_9MICO|nr:HAD-IIA family hydrolase [Lapillicoccus jejuensis]TQJ10978.1 HAD superfamily hydrolase (TIGR01450 family) [Lapillicoccus jejuensis]